VPLGGAITLEQPLEEWDARPANALGLLPGSDPALRDELVVVTAHIDHVGVGRPDATGDSIYNGADDNASGTAGMLEIAEAFAALDRAPARSVLFAAVSGEEKGLLGSHWLAERIPAGYRVVANVNLDMISRNAPDTLAVVGQAMSELGPLVQRIARSNPELGFTVVETMNPELPIIRMSDHAAFLGRGVPAVFFNSGLHPDLHRPSDHVEAGDPDKAARAARLAFLLTHAIAELAAPPALTEEGRRWVEQFGVGARR
ncbi:MAG: M20/M25/M40 family metallo-hydrolase, partial [Gemmatimonadota bacterium]